MLGDIFNNYGVKTNSLTVAPTLQNLQKASIYIIVDPDTEKETEHPHYMNEKEATIIADWVKTGGVLVMLSNDAGNAEFKNFNLLPEKFGIKFIENNKNLVQGNQFEQGAVMTPDGHPIFKDEKKIHLKEISTLEVNAPAETVLKHKGDNIIAIAKYGKGTVFALGDPWIYNEYLDGRRLPPSFDNYTAAEAWVQWLIKQSRN
jgi:unsaturated rhamnogalacturonyl hydrolase